MPKYTIIIEATISDSFPVEADSPEEALAVAAENYANGVFVIDPQNIDEARAAVIDGGCDEPEWKEI
ncbi:MAG: hypothetical protein J6U98_05430 [Abditibacteriota bacterium]|nr:hypothetical protein [Abditibacteriota bacterium]MBP5093927.1 hypothetical protein [Abditibacteriota bacterium]MBP5738328.1 hypothetical protein [Abditibacteriota bacterium]